MPDSLRARAALSQRLRKARLDAGLTGQQLTTKLGPGWGQPKISKLERGKQLPSDDDIAAWADATGVDKDELAGLLNGARYEYETYQAAFTDHGGVAELQEAIAAAEHAATNIAVYQPQVIPGFLQTAQYAQSMLHLPAGPSDFGATDDEIARMIAARMRRAAILYEPGRTITLLIGEGALRNRFGSPSVMRDQLEHIARLAETLTTTTIGVIPFTRPQPAMMINGWNLIGDTVDIETPQGSLTITDPGEVDRYRDYCRLLLDAADTGPAAARLCRAIAAQLDAEES